MRHAIIIHGNSGHGKDTLGDHLGQIIGKNFHSRESFAAPIKRVMMAFTGCPKEVAFGSQEERLRWSYMGLSAREWQQRVGDWGRAIHSDLWIQRWADRIKQGLYLPASITTDGRLERERTATPDFLGPGFHVTNVLIRRPGYGATMSHETEREIAAAKPAWFDYYHENTSLEGLVDFAHFIAEGIFRGPRG